MAVAGSMPLCANRQLKPPSQYKAIVTLHIALRSLEPVLFMH